MSSFHTPVDKKSVPETKSGCEVLTPTNDKEECLIADSKSNEDCLDDDKTKRVCEVLTPNNDKKPSNDKECVIAVSKGSECSSDDDTTGDENSSVLLDKSNKPICPGDVILYYCPRSVAGDPRGLRTATVLSVDPNHSMPLILGNSEGLPSTHLVRRIKVIQNNKLIDHGGFFDKLINSFLTRTVVLQLQMHFICKRDQWSS